MHTRVVRAERDLLPPGPSAQEMLGGGKLQGVLTADEVRRARGPRCCFGTANSCVACPPLTTCAMQVHQVLATRGRQLDFPLFTTIHRIIHGEVPPEMLLRCGTAAGKVAAT